MSGDGRTVSTEHATVRTIGAGLSDPDDNQTFTLRSSGDASLRERQGLPRTFSFDARASVAGDFTAGADSDCDSIVHSYSYVTLDSALPPGFVSVRMVVTGDAQGAFDLQGDTDPGVRIYGDVPGRVDYTFFVSGDDYRIGLDGDTVLRRPENDSSPTSRSGRVTVRGSYVGIGEATSRSTGSAKRYVGLGGRRSCATNTIGAKVTGNASRARTIKKLVIKVNGKRAAKARGPKPGQALTLRGPGSTQAATLVAKVRTTKGRTKTVTRSYAACSA